VTAAEFAAMIKAKYPAYRSVPDDQLVAAMLEKYPTYRSQVETVNTRAQGGDTINGVDPNAPPSLLSRTNEALSHAANPKTTGDFLSLIIPSGAGEAISSIRDMARVAKQGIQESPTIKGIPSSILRVIRERPKTLQDFQSEGFNRLPLADQMKHLPETPAPPVRPMAEPLPKIGIPPTEPKPLYQQVEELPATPAPVVTRAPGPVPSGREAVAPPAPPRLAGKAPSLEDVLTEAIQDAGSQPESGTMSSLAAPIETAGEGALKQSGKFGKRGNLGQAGGYSSGRPGVTPDEYDDLITSPENIAGRSVGTEASGRAPAPSAPASAAPPSAVEMSAPASAPAASSDLTSRVLESLGETETVDPTQLLSSVEKAQPLGPQQIEDARRYLGSRDAAKHLGLSPDEVLKAAPGPSQRPMLLDDLEGGGDRSALIEQFLNDLLRKE
jgi:hypothetical protein